MANGHGGRRPGAGRKRKADELELQGLLTEAWPPDKRLAALERVADVADSDRGDALDALRLLLAYTYGKPVERQEVSGPDGAAIPLEIARIDYRNGFTEAEDGSAIDPDAPGED